MTTTRRYLSDHEKAKVLEYWDRLCNSGPMDAGEGGRGLPDLDMIRSCAELNEIPGVCTIQSCAGHGSETRVVSPGNLWLRLSSAMSAAFDRQAFRLSAQPCIEEVARLYMGWGEEVTSITFAGNERNLLATSLHTVLAFFRSLQHDILSEEEDDGADPSKPPPSPSQRQMRSAMPQINRPDARPWDLTIPLVGGGQATLRTPIPLSEEDYNLLVSMLQTTLKSMKKAITKEPEPAEEEDDRHYRTR